MLVRCSQRSPSSLRRLRAAIASTLVGELTKGQDTSPSQSLIIARRLADRVLCVGEREGVELKH